MRATYKLGRDVITEFEAQNAGNSISGIQISKHFPGGGDARYWNEPRSRYEAGSAPGDVYIKDINFADFNCSCTEQCPGQA